MFKSPYILLACLPGLAFWLNLILWANDHRSGEHYEFIVASILTLGVSTLVMVLCVIGVVRSSLSNDKMYWGVSAVINATPGILLAILLSGRLFTTA